MLYVRLLEVRTAWWHGLGFISDHDGFASVLPTSILFSSWVMTFHCLHTVQIGNLLVFRSSRQRSRRPSCASKIREKRQIDDIPVESTLLTGVESSLARYVGQSSSSRGPLVALTRNRPWSEFASLILVSTRGGQKMDGGRSVVYVDKEWSVRHRR
jgi:hypothetical protein